MSELTRTAAICIADKAFPIEVIVTYGPADSPPSITFSGDLSPEWNNQLYNALLRCSIGECYSWLPAVHVELKTNCPTRKVFPGMIEQATLAAIILDALGALHDTWKGIPVIGGLTLNGQLQPTRNAVTLADAYCMGADYGGWKFIGVPPDQEPYLNAMMPGSAAIGVTNLSELLQPRPEANPISLPSNLSALMVPNTPVPAPLYDACLIAAAGRHNMMIIGSPRSRMGIAGELLATLMGPMALDISDVVATHLCLGGLLSLNHSQRPLRPVRRPHHTVNSHALYGTLEAGVYRPGEVTLAHGGVLMLENVGEWSWATVKGLAKTLKKGVVTLKGTAGEATVMARPQLLLTERPCCCGWWGTDNSRCTCDESMIRRHHERLREVAEALDIHIVHRMMDPDETCDMLRMDDARLRSDRKRMLQWMSMQVNSLERDALDRTLESAARFSADLPVAHPDTAWQLNHDSLSILRVARTATIMETRSMFFDVHNIPQVLPYTLDTVLSAFRGMTQAKAG